MMNEYLAVLATSRYLPGSCHNLKFQCVIIKYSDDMRKHLRLDCTYDISQKSVYFQYARHHSIESKPRNNGSSSSSRKVYGQQWNCSFRWHGTQYLFFPLEAVTITIFPYQMLSLFFSSVQLIIDTWRLVAYFAPNFQQKFPLPSKAFARDCRYWLCRRWTPNILIHTC